MVKYGKSLAILTDSSIVVTHDNGKEPNEWPREVFSNVGTSDEFVRQFALEFMELMGTTLFSETQRDEIKNSIMVLLVEGLLPAYEHLRAIRHFAEQRIPVLNRRQQFESFATELWRAYKTFMPKVVELLGFDIGFLFQNASDFEKGAALFEQAYPRQPVTGYLRKQRDTWQQDFQRFRNEFVEHRGANREEFGTYYKHETAEFLFDVVWKTIANLIPTFIAANYRGGTGIEEIPAHERDPKNPRRFRWVHLMPVPSRPK
jgi:hypothetical protein